MELIARRRKAITFCLAVLGTVDIGYYIYCRDACSYLQGTLAGIDLKYVGVAFMILLAGLVLGEYSRILRVLLAGALGGEIFLVSYQIVQGIYCPFCLVLAVIVIAAFAVNYERPRETRAGRQWLYLAGEVSLPGKAGSLPLVFVVIVGLLFVGLAFSGSATPAYGQEPLPSFGEGKVQIRIYADYLCGPCREMEAAVEPLLEKIIASGRARVTYIDTPMHKETALYVGYYLCAARNATHQEVARIRRALFAAGGKNIGTDEGLREFLGKAGIHVAKCDVSALFKTMNGYFQEDGVKSTPKCVIITPSVKTVYSGKDDVVAALKEYAR